MKCIIMANGDYGEIWNYRPLLDEADVILCADGGANYAYAMGVLPAYIAGDMDSIKTRVRAYYEGQKIPFKIYPRRKDFTDAQLVLELAEELGASEIIFIGSLGKRLDHTLSNLYCGAGPALKGKKVWHYSPDCSAYLVNAEFTVEGEIGDKVSVLALSDMARGVYMEGFEYPLENVILEKWNPYAISNILREKQGIVRVQDGLLLVLHHHDGSF